MNALVKLAMASRILRGKHGGTIHQDALMKYLRDAYREGYREKLPPDLMDALAQVGQTSKKKKYKQAEVLLEDLIRKVGEREGF